MPAATTSSRHHRRAQVNGLRGATVTEDAMRRRVEYDLYYIDNWSPPSTCRSWAAPSSRAGPIGTPIDPARARAPGLRRYLHLTGIGYNA